MSPLELTAAAIGLVSVWLTVKEHILSWPTAIVMVVLYAFVFWEAKLYSDVGLQLVYVVMNTYGWIHWARGIEGHALRITLLSARARSLWLAAIAVSALALGCVMSAKTDASLPYPDALITTMSLAAQWLQARKKLESWVLWVSVDALALYVYAMKGLWPTTALYAVFLGMASFGLLTWKRAAVAHA